MGNVVSRFRECINGGKNGGMKAGMSRAALMATPVLVMWFLIYADIISHSIE